MREQVKVNWDALSEDLKRYGVSEVALSRKLGFSDSYIAGMRKNERNNGSVKRSTVEAVEQAMFRKKGTYTIELDGKEPPKQELKTSADVTIQIIRIMNEQLIEMKALRQDLAAMKQELLSVSNAIRDKVAFTHTAVTTIKETTADIRKELG